MIWGNYVYRIKEYDRAVLIYKRAEELAPNDPEVQYNLGLLYIELKNYDKAKEYAQKAYAQNYPLPGLRNSSAARYHAGDTVAATHRRRRRRTEIPCERLVGAQQARRKPPSALIPRPKRGS